MSIARSFVVTTSTQGSSKTQVWNPARPLPLGHPFRWILESTPNGVRVRNISAPIGEIQKDTVQELTFESIEKGAEFVLPKLDKAPGSEVKFQIRPAADVPAVFDEEPQLDGKIQVYSCYGKWILQTQSLDKSFEGYAHGKPAFKITKKSDQVSIKTHVEGIELGSADAKSRKLSDDITLSLKELSQHVITLGTLSWRFGIVQEPNFKIPHKSAQQTQDPDAIWFRMALRVGALAFGVFCLMTWYWPKPKVQEELIPPQFTKIIMAQPQKPASAESASGAPSAQQQAVAKKVEETKVVQAFRAKALQSAMSGLLKGGMTKLLAQSDFVTGNSATTSGRKLFDSKSDALHATANEVGPMDAKQVKVASLGGGAGGTGAGNAVGYGKGEKAGVTGQGHSFVSMDTMGSSVEEGLTKDEVGEVIHRHMSEVRYCYESAMIRTPDVEGKLIINFNIGGPGNVKTASVKSSSLPDPRLDDCILRRLLTWKFPNTKGGIDVAVSYPFIFKTLGR